jgi:hypothetical protein
MGRGYRLAITTPVPRTLFPNDLIMPPSRPSAHDSVMRRLVPAAGVLLVLVLSAPAAALLVPARTVRTPAAVSAISVTGRAVAYAVGRTRANCGSVRLWNTASRRTWTFGTRTIVGCQESPSGGFGIPSVSVAGQRVFWLTRIGGNSTDWQLWTATPTRPTARRLVFASAGTDGPPPVVLGRGTRDGVPYAVGRTVTFVGPTGVRRFRTSLGAPVRLLTAGTGPDAARVLASLADGHVVLLSKTGAVLRTDDYGTQELKAIALGAPGPVVQTGTTVTIGPAAAGESVTLPAGATLLEYRRGQIVYRHRSQVRARAAATGEDTLLLMIPVPSWQTIPFSTDTGGSAWAHGPRVSWRPGPVAQH